MFDCDADTAALKYCSFRTDAQKEQSLGPCSTAVPLAFTISRPNIASSDATNIEATTIIDASGSA